MTYLTLLILLAFSIGLIINYIIINRKPKRTDYAEHYQKLAERHMARLEETRAKERACNTWEEAEFWELIEPLAVKANGSFFNFVSMLKDKVIRKEKHYLIELDNTFLNLIAPHATELNQNIAKRLFPADEWYFLTYMTFLISKGEQRFNWLANYPHDLFKTSFEISADISISGICGHAYYKQFKELIPKNNCVEIIEHPLWSDETFEMKQADIFGLLQQIRE